MEPVNDRLVIRGAREHNLRNVSLDLPRDKMIVFTGLSGSGKSSLAFDTIFAEGQRRYVESLSSYARQFLGQMDKPDVDFIEGLSPAVSIDQKSTSRNPRSTVGTITEVYDYLRLLYARIGHPHCPICGAPISRQTPQQIVDRLLGLDEGTRFQILAPVIRGRKGEYTELFRQLATDGYARVRVDGEVHPLDDVPALDKQRKHDVDVVVDRVVVKASAKQRITDSIETALGLANGVVSVDFVDREPKDPMRLRTYSEKMACPNGHDIEMDELEPRQFSFNSPWGACPACTGLGTQLEVDPTLVVPDETLTLAEGAIAPWSTPTLRNHYAKVFQGLGEKEGFDVDTPWQDLPGTAQAFILKGYDNPVYVHFRNRFGRNRTYTQKYEGILPYVRRRFDEAETDAARDRWGGYLREIPCSTCHGARLKPSSLAVTVGEVNISTLSDMSISEVTGFVDQLDLTDREKQIAERVVKEIRERLRFLLDVGLDYLTLSRPAGSLSGGEAQRIRLATQIGSGLTGVLYVLDEPSIGLHQRDNRRLIETLLRLRDLGNTLIVVEHDEDTIRAADWVVDIGPGAGEHGGHVVVSGTLDDLLASRESITGAYLTGRRRIEIPAQRHRPNGHTIAVHGAAENNLRGIDVSFPLGQFIAVTGVSGSGKSTLVNQILYTALAKRIYGAKAVPGRHHSITGAENIDKIIHVDQSPIGRTPRSNPATYTGVFDKIRGLFAQTPEAKMRGYQPGRFSFNIKGGRCENCHGDGTIRIEMNFLPDVYVPCEVCHGARYNRETLEVHYKGKSISEVLDMPIEEAAEFFEPIQSIHRHLATLVEVGLGYVRLGQPATTLSGGEAQRVKLASELQKRSTGRTLYVLDEPTTGLHFDDIRKLLTVLGKLVDGGNTVVVIEHNLDVIKTADWVIDMGPEGGARGGMVIAQGTPEQVAADPDSYTGQYLAEIVTPDAAKGPLEPPAEVAAAPGPAPKGTRGRASKAGKPATRTSGAKKSGARASATGRGTATKKAVTTKKKTQRKAA
ncbi:excinuclease ABC subunit UvrA [Propionibacterium freudenreichii]|uniref:excinuclease ABC subunit UvrA n=1 Tax=Propionibacterium freudenreichii TaxID=1744 RepID=UPI0009BE92A6|nr:excinuclease ABC subunit UvrA [Propionibacterium freudenreichii]MCT2974290.1 excinuclease ABC subunit UvrA [Propionibacterium freudenreichii]MCT2977440.1 excinuclease ABC subunit UvrA [Propionibacterium freudenreichii]MCT2984323.1 excinuclease ABC subunit UvrA [Propionibacterium freudenreichii]MCT2985626.1 excinuclease ABC subunit UvrA [Propionibacterium freudenreichii]MDK9346221.1 excinuclease ABC subunit UvrA [Propionibacterium freudenreichii]